LTTRVFPPFPAICYNLLNASNRSPAMPIDLPIIDCDIHPSAGKNNPLDPFVPADIREALRQGMASNKGHAYVNPFGVCRRDTDCGDPARVAVELLDRYHIVHGILQSPGMGISIIHNIDIANALATAWNDWQINTWLAADARYCGSVAVNMNDPPAAAKEIRRVGSHPKMVQISVTDEALHLYGHRCYFPIYEACQEFELPFCLHVGGEGSYDSSTPVGRPSSYFEWHTGVPITLMSHLISMVAEGVFEKFPKLKLVLTEGGVSWFSHVMWRMDKNFKALRSTTPWLRRKPSEYMIEHVRLTTQPMEDPENIDQLIQMLGMVHAEKTVCFATDFPHWDFDAPDMVLPRKVPQELRQRIFYENAAELYGFPTLAELKAAEPQPFMAAPSMA
jgi:predicted TIM-barrel fold metal-dependent hydrolase